MGMSSQSPIFVRIFKQESELEVWKQKSDGRFYLFRTYPICHWSGALGPKRRQGDKQSPEGYYTVAKWQMNPNSSFHLAFNLGYPNAYDRAHGHTGDFLMVHGKCRSAGCYAMTDALIEEIYALAREAFAGGQEKFHVHSFPFRMTDVNLERHKNSRYYRFWKTLKEGYDHFEQTRLPPNVVVCQRRYMVNVEWNGRKLDPTGYCPRFKKPVVSPFIPSPQVVSQ
ncbi:MAG TPA: murein L,D-transpeptidase family protein [Hyphomicrobiaceae bacterium]|nr:murein L,D-transpeptidase family protein [Hyphomicrobiaceae bacterium]